jgi:hypothetical protein
MEYALHSDDILKAEQIVNTLKKHPHIYRCLPAVRLLLMYEKIGMEREPLQNIAGFPGTAEFHFPAQSYQTEICRIEEKALSLLRDLPEFSYFTTDVSSIVKVLASCSCYPERLENCLRQ